MLSFSNIFGQDRAIDRLRRSHRAGRLPHGMIFAGPTGVGKATTAQALAAMHLCQALTDDDPCGTCESCRLICAGTHPDYHVIIKELIRYHDKTGKSKGVELSLDVIRPELIAAASRKPMFGHGKVFIIEQSERMTTGAQNAMLKTLEEPADRTLIILLTDQPGLLLPTIRSRCQLIHFASLDRERVQQELVRRGVDQTVATDAAALSEGSLGLAIQWIADGVVEAARQLQDVMERLVAGTSRGEELALPDWFKRSAEAYAEKQLARDELASKDQATREGLGLYLRLASQVFRRHLSHSDDSDELARSCAAIEAIGRAESYLDANVNMPLIFQQLAMTLRRQFTTSA